MGRKLDAKCAQCRRAGVKLFLKGERCYSAKCAMVKRNYPPGVHGVKGRTKTSGYGEQLNEKQKAKRIYGIMERQFSKYYTLAIKQTGDAGENLLRFLELRLDNIVYRLGFASSRNQAREAVTHGLFTVNGKKLDVPSYQVKVGDVISLVKRTKMPKLFDNLEEKLKKAQIPSWLALETSQLSGKLLDKPKKSDLESNFDIKSIIEFYSR